MRAGKRRKSEMRDELVHVLGLHRKSAVRLLKKRRPGREAEGKKRGPKPRYDAPEFVKALRCVWSETDFMCAKLLHAAMKTWLCSVERDGRGYDLALDTGRRHQ